MGQASLRQLLLAASILAAMPATARAATPEDDRVDRLLDALVEEGVLTRDKANAIAVKVSSPSNVPAPSPAATSSSEPSFVAVQPPAQGTNADPSVNPAAPVVRNAASAAAAADWTKRFKIDGDFRFRWQGEYYSNDTSATIPNYNALASGATALPTSNFLAVDDRTRQRYRARLGFTAKVTDRVTAVLRLAVGNELEPVSTDETLGDYFNRDDIVADRAYVRYAIDDSVALLAGRMANPFYTTNMIWDGDVNPEGIAATLERPIGGVNLFATAGVFTLQENADTTADRYLYAGQIGADDVKLWDGASAKLGLAYYHYANIEGIVGEPGTRQIVLQKGNTLLDIDPRPEFILPALASRFRTVDLVGAVDQKLGDHVLTGSFDLAWNLGYDESRFAALPLLTEPGGDFAWLASLTFGTPSVAKRGDWQSTLSYRRIESDAVLAAFNEGDFNLGGTNSEGLVLDAVYGLTTNTSVQLSYMNTHSIVGPTYQFQAVRVAFNTRF